MRQRKITISASVQPRIYDLLNSAAALNMRSVSAEISDRLVESFGTPPNTDPVTFTAPPAADTPGKRALVFLKAEHPRVFAMLDASGRYRLQLYVDGQL
jgi:hypothetical protein